MAYLTSTLCCGYGSMKGSASYRYISNDPQMVQLTSTKSSFLWARDSGAAYPGCSGSGTGVVVVRCQPGWPLVKEDVTITKGSDSKITHSQGRKLHFSLIGLAKMFSWQGSWLAPQ